MGVNIDSEVTDLTRGVFPCANICEWLLHIKGHKCVWKRMIMYGCGSIEFSMQCLCQAINNTF